MVFYLKRILVIKQEEPPWYQFHLSTLFILMIATAFFYIGLGWWGFDGFWERFSVAMRIGVVIFPFVELHRRFRNQDFPSDSN